MDKRKGHRGVKIGEAGPTVAPGGEEGTGENKEVESLTEGKSAGSHD